MSKSLARVMAALAAAGEDVVPMEMPGETRTAVQAAEAAGSALDQIVKSIVLGGPDGALFLFLTAGGNQVDIATASTVAGAALQRADPTVVRRVTGFAIGGVAPLGHLGPLPVWHDPHLLNFEVVWAAAGTPRHIFPIRPTRLVQITGAKPAHFTC
jgi:prolyl-tRNA editing enzyme YbaK/EbsC (Cys-tRNA(Pro) deacylase)